MPGQTRERERVDHELFDRLVAARAGLVIEDMDHAIADLHDIDMAGDDLIALQSERYVIPLRMIFVPSQ